MTAVTFIIGWGVNSRFKERKAFVSGFINKMRNNKQLFKTRAHPARGRYDGFVQSFSMKDLVGIRGAEPG